MKAQRILHLEARHLTAYRRAGEHWVSDGQFGRDADDMARFATYLQQHRQRPFHLLADLADEAMLLDSIPRLRGRDRQTLIARKLGQHFPSSTLRLAVSLGHEKSTHHRETLGLSAFTEAGDFAPWLDQIAANDSQLVGLYSVSQLLPGVLAQLGQRAPHCLFLQQGEEVRRETFLRDGQVHFCRIIAAAPGHAAGLAQEAVQLQHYLLKQQRIARGEALPVFILAAQDNAATPAGLVLQLPAGHTQTRLFLDALAEHPPAAQFASPAQRRAFTLARIRRAASTLATLVLLGSLPLAAGNFASAQRLRTEAGQWRDKAAALQRDALPVAAAQPAALRHITERYAELIRQQRQPTGAYLKLSRALDQHPDIHLESLDWQADAGRESLVVRGIALASAAPSGTSAPAAFAHFVAALAVDRDSTLHVRQRPQQGEQAQADEALPASHDFIIEIRQKP